MIGIWKGKLFACILQASHKKVEFLKNKDSIFYSNQRNDDEGGGSCKKNWFFVWNFLIFCYCCLEAHVFQAPKRSPDDFSTVDIFIAFLEVQQATMARAVILVDSSIMHEQVA